MADLNKVVILSLFPGIDLLGKAFEQQGFCVVKAPDLITGGDIVDFNVPAGRFDAIIGGPPCQDFSRLNRNPGTYGHRMLDQFCRIIRQSECQWFLFENVVTAPEFEISGYQQQRFALDLAWFSEFSRRRDFVYGSREGGPKAGRWLDPINGKRGAVAGGCVTGSDERSFAACCEIQGLPGNFDVPFFTLAGKKQAVANAVPMALGKYVAQQIASHIYGVTDATIDQSQALRRCKCGCKRAVYGRSTYTGATCRKRAQRARNSE